MEDGITFETKMGDGSDPDQGLLGKMFGAGKRMLTGESLFMTHFSNQASEKSRVSFAAPFPGSVIAVDMAKEGKIPFLPQRWEPRSTLPSTKKSAVVFWRRRIYSAASGR